MSTMQTPPYVLANSYQKLLQLDPENAVAPINAYVPPDSFLIISTWSAVAGTLAVSLRMMMNDGTIKQMVWQPSTTSDRSKQTLTVPLTEGFLISLEAFTPGAGNSNRTYVQLRLAQGSLANINILGVLCEGYVSNGFHLAWPPGVFLPQGDGNGALVSVTGTLPAAGAEISETVPANARWELISIVYTLTTSATVANRFTRFVADDGANIFTEVPQPTAQIASNTFTYNWFHGALNTAGSNVSDAPMPLHLTLNPGFRWRTNTVALQAGDQYSAPQYLVREWIFP
jgi:hypothetical protein